MAKIKPCNPALLPLAHLDWAALAPLIGDAREAIARLDEEMKGASFFLEPFFWQEAIASLRSQGYAATIKEALLYAHTGLCKEAKEPLLQKISFVKQALHEAYAQDPQKVWGQRFFCHLHAIVKQDASKPDDIGRVRNRQNWIGVPGCSIENAHFYPPSATNVKPLLRNFESYLKHSETDPLVQTAIAFAQFLTIHPFMDGNGRVARIFIPFFALQKGLLAQPVLLLSAYFAAHRRDYFQKLHRLQQSRCAWEDWILFFLKGALQESQKIKHQIQSMKKMYATAENLVGKKNAEELFKKLCLKKKKSRSFDLLIKEKILILRGGEFCFFEPLLRILRAR